MVIVRPGMCWTFSDPDVADRRMQVGVVLDVQLVGAKQHQLEEEFIFS